MLGSRVHKTNSSSSPSPSSSSSSSLSSLAGILPNALADFLAPFTPLGVSSSRSISSSARAWSCFAAASRRAFLVFAGSLGPPLRSSSSSLSSSSSSSCSASIASISSMSNSSSSSSLSSSSGRRMSFKVARGTASSSPSGSADGSMAAIVMRNAEGMSDLAGIGMSPQGTSRP